MGERSAVGGSIKFTALHPDPAKAELRAKRKELERIARSLGGSVEFFAPASDVNPDFIHELVRTPEYASLEQFFNIEGDELVERGDIGFDRGLEAAAAKLVELAGEHDVLANGAITVYDDEQIGNIWRIFIKDNAVQRQQASIVWPDGTSE